MVFDMFHESIQDNLDLFGHLAMESEGEEQLKYWKNFQQFHALLSEDGRLEYGRINTRLAILRETVDLTVGLLLMNPDVDAENFAEYQIKPLDDWSRSDWKQCKKGLNEVLEIVLLKGATVGINEENDETIAEGRAESKRYNIEKLCRGLDACAILAPLRSALKDQLVKEGTPKRGTPKRGTPKRGTPKLNKSIKLFLKEIEKLEDPSLTDVMKELVVEDETSGDLKLKDIDTVRKVLVNDALSVERIAIRTIEKFKTWNKHMFPEPRLYHLHFDEDDVDHVEDAGDCDEEGGEEEEDDEEETEAQNVAVQHLRYSRARLMDSVDDPLEAAVAAATNATTTRERRMARAKTNGEVEDDVEEEEVPSPKMEPVAIAKHSSSTKRKRQGENLLTKKKSATQMKFDDDEENIPDPPEDTLLSDLPERASAARSPARSPMKKPKKSQEISYQGRRVWTDQEKQAVKEGIRQLGLGKWAQIKVMYKLTLQHRTSGQIKDCYRTMAKRNELGDVLDSA